MQESLGLYSYYFINCACDLQEKKKTLSANYFHQHYFTYVSVFFIQHITKDIHIYLNAKQNIHRHTLFLQ